MNKTAAAHDGFEVSQLGSVTTTKATDAAFASMLETAAMIAIPLTLISSCSCSAPPSRRSFRCCSRSPRCRDDAPARTPEPVHRRRRVDRRGDPADRPRRRNRLLALLPPARARRACRRTERGRRPRGRRRHLRPRRPHLRRHRDDRDGRHVPVRRQDVHVLLDRHDDGRRDRDARLAHRAAGAARQARRPGREGSLPFLHRLRAQGRREPRLGRDPRPRPAPPGRLGGRGHGSPRRADGAGPLAEHGDDRRRRHLDRRDRAAEEVRRGLPGRQPAGRGRDQGRGRPRPSRSRTRSPSSSGRRSRPAR